MRRSLRDPEWAERVWQRYERRRGLPGRQLRAAFEALAEVPTVWLDRQLRRWPRFYRWLAGEEGDR